MELSQCPQCAKEIEGSPETCPQCGTDLSRIPDYPRFGGGVFIAMWIFFVILIIVLLVSMFSV